MRDESTYEDVLGIVGAGPLGAFEGMSVQTNADGYKFVVAPTADGYFPQGFKVDGLLNITGYQPELGLRQSIGNDPAHLGTGPTDGVDAFSLGQGTPQIWSESDPTVQQRRHSELDHSLRGWHRAVRDALPQERRFGAESHDRRIA